MRHPLKELGRHVVSIQFLFWEEVFSVYTVSRDTYDNVFNWHDLFVNIVQVHNVLSSKLSTAKSSRIATKLSTCSSRVYHIMWRNLSCQWDTVSCATKVKASKWVQVLQPSTFSLLDGFAIPGEEFKFVRSQNHLRLRYTPLWTASYSVCLE